MDPCVCVFSLFAAAVEDVAVIAEGFIYSEVVEAVVDRGGRRRGGKECDGGKEKVRKAQGSRGGPRRHVTRGR